MCPPLNTYVVCNSFNGVFQKSMLMLRYWKWNRKKEQHLHFMLANQYKSCLFRWSGLAGSAEWLNDPGEIY
jgi:hypothetical protein